MVGEGGVFIIKAVKPNFIAASIPFPTVIVMLV